jgi:hypothetical protein
LLLMLRPNDVIYGIPVSEIARICGVDLATARRWKRGATCPPQSALMLLAGDLGVFDVRWRGWRIQRGFLVSPEGWSASTGDVLSIQLTQAQLAAYRHENKNLKAEIDAIETERTAYEDQPAPEAWILQIK